MVKKNYLFPYFNTNAANWSAQVVKITPKAENAFCNGSLAFSPMLANLSCNGSNDGFISGITSGGNAPYSYSWSNGGTNNTLNNLSAGLYNLALTDAYGCTINYNYTITEPPALSAAVSSTDESYFQSNNGTATISVTGGTPPYTYNWSNGGNTNSINNLTPGSYTIGVTDANGCNINEMVTIQAINCNSLSSTLSITDESYYQANDGTATATVSGGIYPYTYSWSNGATAASANNLTPGTHSVNITDGAGCSLSETLMVNALVCNTLNVSVSTKHESCQGEADGLLQITNMQNGTAPYSILWSTGITGTVINNLVGSTYQLEVTDAVGCSFSENYIINAAVSINATTIITGATTSGSNDGAIDLSVLGGTPPYAFYWSDGSTTEDISGLSEANYWVSITDANNCQVMLSNLNVGSSCPIFIVQHNQPVLTTAIYQVDNFIKSNGLVNINEQVGFKAGSYIELNSDFEVIQGAKFEAKIEGCQ